MESINDVTIDKQSDIIAHRKSLLPWWIKGVGWLYVVIGVFSIFCLLMAFLPESEIYLDSFGITYEGQGVTLTLLIIVAINIFLSVTAFGLLRGKDWGLNACIANGYVGMTICLVVMIMSFLNGVLEIRLEPIVQIVYLRKLYTIKESWYCLSNKNLTKQSR